MPAPPDLIFSARVPCGVISSSNYPSKYCLSNSAFYPTYEEIILLICLFLNKTDNPQSFLPVSSPTPQLFETMVKSLTPIYLTPLMRFMGTPHIPNPPTSTLDPLFIPERAYWTFGTNLLIFEKK